MYRCVCVDFKDVAFNSNKKYRKINKLKSKRQRKYFVFFASNSSISIGHKDKLKIEAHVMKDKYRKILKAELGTVK